MPDVLGWWLAVEVIGLAALPLTFVFLGRLPDRGYALSKTLGLLISGYVLWILNMAHLLPNTPRGVAGAVVIVGILSAWVAWRRRDDLSAFVRERWGYVVAVEGLFLAAFLVGAWLRSYVPDIEGTEKPMDFMFLNAASRAERFPPPDPWLSGLQVAYYYFGYMLVGMVGQLAGVATNVGYNLGLAMIAALTCVGAFGVVYDLTALRPEGEEKSSGPPWLASAARAGLLVKPAIFGFVALVFVAIMGNLEGIFEFAAANGRLGSGFYDWLEIKQLGVLPANSDRWYPTEEWQFWWWFRASRVLSRPFEGGELEIITEFPFFSFLLGDLHPHVMALPFMMLAAGVALHIILSPEPLDLVYWLQRPAALAGCALVVGGLGFINTWDAPTFGMLLAAVALVRNLQLAGEARARVWRRTLDIASFALPLAAVALLTYAPFFFGSLDSQAQGVSAVSDPGTRPVDAVIFWGPMAIVLAPFLGRRLWNAHRARPLSGREVALSLALPAALLLAWLVWDGLAAVGDTVGLPLREAPGGLGDRAGERRSELLTLLAFGLAFGAAALALWRELQRDASAHRTPVLMTLTLTALALLLVYNTELFFLVDTFGNRMNTAFKLWYQAWALLGLATGFAAFDLWRAWFQGGALQRARGWPLAWAAVASLVAVGGLLYPVGATLSRSDGLRGERTLNGLNSVRRADPGEYDAIQWLYDRRRADIVIAEALGGDYSYGGRMSAATGIPTLLQWPGHEFQWRGETESQGSRQTDIERLYTTLDADEVAAIVNQYGVNFVIVGRDEREKYPAEGLSKFEQVLGPPRFQSGQTAIYSTFPVLERGP